VVAQPDKTLAYRTVLCWSGMADIEHHGSYGKEIGLQFDYLFSKLPQPVDSEVTFSVFESNSLLLLPV